MLARVLVRPFTVRDGRARSTRAARRPSALEPRTLELVRWHRRYLTRRNHPGIKTGLLFPSEAGTRPVGNDQLNDVWREVQVLPGIDRPVKSDMSGGTPVGSSADVEAYGVGRPCRRCRSLPGSEKGVRM